MKPLLLKAFPFSDAYPFKACNIYLLSLEIRLLRKDDQGDTTAEVDTLNTSSRLNTASPEQLLVQKSPGTKATDYNTSTIFSG